MHKSGQIGCQTGSADDKVCSGFRGCNHMLSVILQGMHYIYTYKSVSV